MSGPGQPDPERNGVVQPGATSQDIYDGGMAVRREVLSDEHVDRANAAKDGFTEDFQDMITRIAWGGIWTRPGLTRQMRSAVTITAMVAHGHWEELAMHIRAALRNGLSRDEIKEILLQTAIYCGVVHKSLVHGVVSIPVLSISRNTCCAVLKAVLAEGTPQ